MPTIGPNPAPASNPSAPESSSADPASSSNTRASSPTPNGSSAPTASEPRSRLRGLIASAATGLLLATAYEPYDLGPIALVALIPLLWAWRDAGPRRGALYGLTAGSAFFAVLVSWSWYFGSIAYVPFVLVLAVWWALAGAVVGWLRVVSGRPVPAPAVAAVWVLVEAAFSRWPWGGFSWGEVGYAFSGMTAGRSLAAWGGVPLVGFLAVTINGLLLEAALRRRHGIRSMRTVAAGLATIVAAAGAAHVLLPDIRTTGRLRVALVQGNDKNRHLTIEEVRARYLPENHFRLARQVRRPVDLVIFPESSLDRDPRDDPALDSRLAALAGRLDTTLLASGNTDAPNDLLYNTTFVYGPSGRSDQLYRKRHLVPFGEFVPFRDALSFVRALDAIPYDFAPGEDPLTVTVAGHKLGILICFESAFSGLSRNYVRDGAEAIVVSTNNRSFRRSANSAQHVALGQMRAAETGRPVIHSGISGISALIDARGRVQETRPLFEATVLEGVVQTTTGYTPYVDHGDWILAVAAAIAGGLGLSAVRRRRPGAEVGRPSS